MCFRRRRGRDGQRAVGQSEDQRDVRLARRLGPLPSVLSALLWDLVATPQVGEHLADRNLSLNSASSFTFLFLQQGSRKNVEGEKEEVGGGGRGCRRGEKETCRGGKDLKSEGKMGGRDDQGKEEVWQR